MNYNQKKRTKRFICKETVEKLSYSRKTPFKSRPSALCARWFRWLSKVGRKCHEIESAHQVSKIQKAKILVCKIRKVRSELRKLRVDENDRKERGFWRKRRSLHQKGIEKVFYSRFRSFAQNKILPPFSPMKANKIKMKIKGKRTNR